MPKPVALTVVGRAGAKRELDGVGNGADGGDDVGVARAAVDEGDEGGGLRGARFAGGIGFGVRVGPVVDGDVVSLAGAGGEEGVFDGGLAWCGLVIEGEVLEEEGEAVGGLDAGGVGLEVKRAGGGGKGAGFELALVPEANFAGRAGGGDVIEGGPIDPIGFRGIERLETGGKDDVEGERGAGEIEIRQVTEARMLVEVVGIPEHEDGEIG